MNTVDQFTFTTATEFYVAFFIVLILGIVSGQLSVRFLDDDKWGRFLLINAFVGMVMTAVVINVLPLPGKNVTVRVEWSNQ